ncbi:TIGR04255 family protein [Sphingomonas sp. S2-65]|uniref:TIGR04255 family protein n=1 Tax=Sphingomonas sp. S2-65 TaxID=2903960 RepID=UPI001F2E44CE|nr:TIGR04255 family protein [Sphingomonas sp. S2-65]UYY60137.1 TIGR04255 family protein [Sphingomonas sp. S2-65]
MPDFGSPPLNEAVLGIQFREAEGYQQIRAGEVWNLYRADYPAVEEQQALPPTFETFGPLQIHTSEFQLIQGAQHDRFWFLNSRGDELIQFQSDRLFHNWRKREDVDRPYPRFESMIAAFEREAEALERYFGELWPQKIEITQAEIGYINHFPLGQPGEFSGLDDYLSIVNLAHLAPEAAQIRYRRIVPGRDGKPTGRLHVETNIGQNAAGEVVGILNLTYRGAPSEPGIAGAVGHLTAGREVIVNEFTAITTDKAHKLWDRK